MNKKICILTILLLAGINYCNAQYGYINGYVVTNSNDTLFGEVKDRNAFPNILFDKVKFKSSTDGKKMVFSPTQIKCYKKGEEYFESITCFLDTAVFVKVVKEGFISLYKYEYGSFETSSGYGSTFLLRKQDSPCVTEISRVDAKDQLLHYFDDTNLVQERIHEKEVNGDQLADLVNVYNQHYHSK